MSLAQFAALCDVLDRTSGATDKLAALSAALVTVRATNPTEADAMMAVLTAPRRARLVPPRRLARWAMAMTDTPDWLFESCYDTVGDLTETISLLLPPTTCGTTADAPLGDFITTWLTPLADVSEAEQQAAIMEMWRRTSDPARALINRLITGVFRPPIPARVLARVDRPSGVPFDPIEIAPTRVEELGEANEWIVDWHWGGTRAQIVRRGGVTTILTEHAESIAPRFPALVAAASHLSDGIIIVGEIVGIDRFISYDLLEMGGVDISERPYHWRRDALAAHVTDRRGLSVPRALDAPTWSAIDAHRHTARAHGAAGIRLTDRASAHVQRLWPVDPLVVDAVMVYAQSDEYTFALWEDGTLVPFAKTAVGLSEPDARRLDTWVRRHTVERFGPVRAVNPELVFEIGFQRVERSTRHKSGVLLHGTHIRRWRTNATAADAGYLDSVRAVAVEPRRDP